ncbi:hypothetical protein G7025_21620 [Pseudomonas lurida]|jgi:hypothetical protein|uniref:hypothetical protein n=1 Tax=Pseudomonas TaxID=286 RepID=UPI0015E29D7C|nr:MULTISPECIES: hypothetical protein [Pseudomonas]MBA1295967.1 hypothetical protein [Pseudomonas lurida]
MLSTQRQNRPPVRFPRLNHAALAGVISSFSQTVVLEDRGTAADADEVRLLDRKGAAR